MKKFGIFITAVLLLPLLAACGGGSDADPTPVATQPPATLAVPTPRPTATSTPQRTPPLALEALSMTRSSPDEGWITYRVQLAVRNTGDAPVLLSTVSADTTSGGPAPAMQPGVQAVALRISDASVSTDQNHPYPANFSYETLRALDSLVIPPGLAVTTPGASRQIGSNRWVYYSFSTSFKVPELLHPTQVNINPGIVSDGITTPVTLDLADVPEQRTGFVNSTMDGAPLGSFDSGPLAVNLATAPGYLWAYDQDGGFTGAVDMTIKNTDITGDQAVDLKIAVLDGYGVMFRAIDWDPPSGCVKLPESIGPGQTFTGSVCFRMPGRNADGTVPAGLLVTTPEDVHLYTMTTGPENLVNCSPQGLAQTVHTRGHDYPIQSEYTISVPGHVDGSIHRDSEGFPDDLGSGAFHRILIETPGNQTISIRVTPNTPVETGYNGWLLMLRDPSGTTIAEDQHGDPSTPAVLQNLPLLCSGTYAFYIRLYGTVIGDEEYGYQVTVSTESMPAATPLPSPEPIVGQHIFGS